MSDKVKELKACLDSYHRKLARVMAVISSSDKDESQQNASDNDLSSVMKDLLDIIALTEQQIEIELNSQHSYKDPREPVSGTNYPVRLEESEEISESSSNESENEKTLEEDFTGEPVKVMAPFRHMNGEVEYLPAFYFQTNSAQNPDREDVLSVFYLTPLNDKMQPCLDFPFCERKFCKFSHGVKLKYSQLRKFRGFQHRALKLGRRVLFRPESETKLWSQGIISVVSQTEDKSDVVIEVADDNFKRFVLPMERVVSRRIIKDVTSREDESSGDSSNNSTSEISDTEEEHDQSETSKSCSSKTHLPHESDGKVNANSKSVNSSFDAGFGGWESYTKGIGSKLLSKMGYVQGKGLGKDSGGRVLPVEATILPARKSLDVCMRLKSAKRVRNVGENISRSKHSKLGQVDFGESKNPDQADLRFTQGGANPKSKPKSGGDVFKFMNKNVGARSGDLTNAEVSENNKSTSENTNREKSSVNNSISQIHKMCAGKSQLQLNTLLMQKRAELDRKTNGFISLQRKAEVNYASVAHQMLTMRKDIEQSKLQVSTIEKMLAKNLVRKELSF